VRRSEGFLKGGDETSKSVGKWKMRTEVQWSAVTILGEMCVWLMIYSYVAVCMICAVRCVITIFFFLLVSNYSTDIFNIFMSVFCFVCLFSFCVFCFCTVLCIASPFVYICLFPIFVQVYRQLPPGGNRIAVNKYHIIYISYRIILQNNHLTGT
jgi:hypothetical protein